MVEEGNNEKATVITRAADDKVLFIFSNTFS